MADHTKDLYDKKLHEIQKAYFDIGHMTCLCLDNKAVYFNQAGFRHFLGKGRVLRPIKDQLRRFNLFQFVKKVISSSKTQIAETRENKGVLSYALELEVQKNLKVRVVVIKNDEGHFHFVSIMDRN